MQLIQLAHQIDVIVTDTNQLPVGAGSANIQRQTLSTNGQFMRSVHLLLAPGRTQRPSALAKKSFSSANSPIFACKSFS